MAISGRGKFLCSGGLQLSEQLENTSSDLVPRSANVVERPTHRVRQSQSR
jgi:hypothetical protein